VVLWVTVPSSMAARSVVVRCKLLRRAVLLVS